MAFFSKLFSTIAGGTKLAPVEFQPLSAADRAVVEKRLAQAAKVSPVPALIELLDRGEGTFARESERVLDEVKRRCKDVEVWQSFFLDLLDDDSVVDEGEGEGVGAEPVDQDEELRRLLAGVRMFPHVRSRYAWELGYHVLRYALAQRDDALARKAAAAAAEDYLLAFDGANDAESKVSAMADLAGAWLLAGEADLAIKACDWAAALSAEDAVRQDLHRLRKEGADFVRESYGAKRK